MTVYLFFFFKQNTAYEMRISDWSSDVCSSDLTPTGGALAALTALWLAGRLAMWFAAPPLAALCDGLFLPLAALAFTRVLMRAGNRRNYPIALALWEIGSASCRERVCSYV